MCLDCMDFVESRVFGLGWSMQSGDKEGCSSLGRLGSEGVGWCREDGVGGTGKGEMRLGVFERVERGFGSDYGT